ncbi:MAG: response regulator [Azospirillum sp.]|nr:response regulator [Azospirillum sp.]
MKLSRPQWLWLGVAVVAALALAVLLSVLGAGRVGELHWRWLTRLPAAIGIVGIVGGLGALFYLQRSTIQRLEALHRAIKARIAGEPAPIPCGGLDEIGEMARAVAFFVNEIERREAAFRDSEARFRGLIEGSIEGIVIHREFVPLFANDAYARIFGYEEAAQILALPSLEPLLPPDVLARAWRNYLRMLDGSAPPGLRRFAGRCRDGSTIWIDAIERPVDWLGQSAVLVTIVDVSQHVRAEADAAENAALLQAAFDTMPNGICMLDDEMRVAVFNQKFVSLWNFPPELLPGRPGLIDLIGFSAERGDFGEIDAGALIFEIVTYSRSSLPMSGEIPLADGRTLEIRGNSRPRGGYVLTFSDVSERRRSDAALHQAKDAAEEAARAKSAFLATMSHEIRTPMNGVLGMLEVLDRSRLDGEQRQAIGVIRESAATLLEIIDDILDFSKIEAGRLPLERVELSLAGIVDGIADLLASRVREKQLELVVGIDPALRDDRYGDPVRLRQILLNLVGNAIKFTDVGWVAVRVAAAGRGDADAVRFEVEDTGIGLTRAQLDRLFQPFTQADASTTRRFGGSGLGLSICRRLVEMMGGTIGASARPGKGSTFWFELPLAPCPEAAAVAAVDLAGLRVLVADDLAAAAACFASVLAAAGADVTTAGDPESALAVLRQAAGQAAAVDVVVADHDGERFDGVTLVEVLRQIVELERTAVLLLAQADSKITEVTIGRLGIAAVLAKPVRRDALLRAVARAAGRTVAEACVPDVGDHGERVAPPSRQRALAEGTLILVAEDNPTNQVVIRKQLDRLGFACDVAADGVEALRALGEAPYGLLLTDCFMPRLDGYDLVRRWRAGETDGQHLPIVALTASALPGEAERCLSAGMDTCLTKPVTLATLERVIGAWLPKALDLRQPMPEAEAPAGPPAAAAGTGAVSVLDLDAVANLFGDAQVVAEMLQFFLETTRPLIEEAGRALRVGGFEDARAAIHAAAGAARTASAGELAALCSQIELDLVAGDAAAANARIPELNLVFDRVAAVVDRETARTSASLHIAEPTKAL